MARKVGGIPVAHRAVSSCEESEARYPGLETSSSIIPVGYRKEPGFRAFHVPTRCDRDIQIPLRDGVKLRADVFRPVHERKVPALLVWSPYGKSGAGFFNLDLVPGRVGIPSTMLSGMEKFEGLDPAEWVGRDYAIVNIDARGAFDSEGDIIYFGTAEGRDGYDTVEYLSQLPWCSGSVAMVGNSWLAISQWFIAAERPPHLSCIAPWEGASDLYREILYRGGVPYKPFFRFLAEKLYGRNEQEDILKMMEQYPYMNGYWADKRAKISEINIPAYILASFSTGLHTTGSFRGFQDIPHDKKWLRVHHTQEWHDIYQPENINDLCLFLDRYTKGFDNGWENTPPVRLSILAMNQDAIINHPFTSWPIPATRYQTLFLDNHGSLGSLSPTEASSGSYQADVPAVQIDNDPEEVLFNYTFTERSYLIGYPRVILHMSCDSHNDMDVFVQLRKSSKDGKILQNLNIPLQDLGLSDPADVVPVNTNFYLGPTGILRASHRSIHPELSKPDEIIYTHAEADVKKVNKSDVVELSIGMVPTAIMFEAGEKLVLKVAGHPLILAEFVPLRGEFAGENKGRHCIHFGGRYDSRVEIPLVNL